MASTDVLSQTLSSITAIKLDEISSQQQEFGSAKTEILRAVSRATDQPEKVRVLLEGVGRLTLFGKLKESPTLPLKNIEQFLQQARHDPSVTTEILKDWQAKLENELGINSLKYKYATLYSHLVKEWLAANDNTETFENVGRTEMHEQRVTWEEMVFNAKETDTEAIQAYLQKLFTSNKATRAALKVLRQQTKDFETQMSEEQHFDEDSLKSVINGLLRSDLVTDEKRQVLKDFLNNKIVLAEVADVLNMRIGSLDKWSWDTAKGTLIEQRRHLNGRYRFYADEDLLQTILLRYLGLKWSVFFKETLTAFRVTQGVWAPPAEKIPTSDRLRREYFLYPDIDHSPSSVEGLRTKHFREEIFLEQLADSLDEERGGYGDDDEQETDTRKTGQAITQKLLHTLTTEINVLTRLGEDVSVVRSDFAWFGPSLPHSTIFAVLRFFNVSEQWVEFFRRAIEAPVKFLVDGKDGPINIRKRGTPVSGPLSDFLAEMILFCLDFGFNSSTKGLTLYRLHDDIWFWGSDKQCIQGWTMMTRFAELMGLDFSAEKTGSIKIDHTRNQQVATPSGLPKGDVQWGFMKLESNGRFVIDQKKVDLHIAELRRQLGNCKSVLDWIQCWNIYGVRFFTTNFGKAANCYGLAHVDMLLETFGRIQAKLFSSTGGSVTSTLKSMITERFHVDDIPEGYLFWPSSFGGLDLKSPFVNLYLIRDTITKSPDSHMDEFFRQEEGYYEIAKTRFENDPASYRRQAVLKEVSSDTFMSFEEFTRYRLQTSSILYSTYTALLREPYETNLVITTDVGDGFGRGGAFKARGRGGFTRGRGGRRGGISKTAASISSPYQRWIIELYASDMTARFGSLNVVEKGLLPAGLVSMFRESRFKWQG